MKLSRIVTMIVAGCAAAVMSAAPGLSAQTPQEHQHPASDTAQQGSGMAVKDRAMMAQREKMMADMKAADQQLDALVVKMNTTSGAEQTTATANVVTEMVTQRRTMQAGMMKMQDGMMAHMMEHMQAGTASMASCPMMKQMGGAKP
jgi:hypothetical protein